MSVFDHLIYRGCCRVVYKRTISINALYSVLHGFQQCNLLVTDHVLYSDMYAPVSRSLWNYEPSCGIYCFAVEMSPAAEFMLFAESVKFLENYSKTYAF